MGCPGDGTSPAASSGSAPVAPDSACRCPPSVPATVPRPSASLRTPRCPRPSHHPLQPLRRCAGPSPMPPPAGSPPAIPCRQGRESADQVLPSLSHVARSGVSERSPTLLDSRQWSCPCLLSVPFPTQGPFPRRALPRVPGTTGPSATLPARPAPRGVPVAACTAPAGVPVLLRLPSSMHADAITPAETGRCFVALFPAGRRPSPDDRRVGFRVKRFEACSAFTRVPACMVAEPPRVAALLSRALA